jgi:hypothetical protein
MRKNMITCEQCLNKLEDGAPIYFCRECREDYCSSECVDKHLNQNVHKENLGWGCITNPKEVCIFVNKQSS